MMIARVTSAIPEGNDGHDVPTFWLLTLFEQIPVSLASTIAQLKKKLNPTVYASTGFDNQAMMRPFVAVIRLPRLPKRDGEKEASLLERRAAESVFWGSGCKVVL